MCCINSCRYHMNNRANCGCRCRFSCTQGTGSQTSCGQTACGQTTCSQTACGQISCGQTASQTNSSCPTVNTCAVYRSGYAAGQEAGKKEGYDTGYRVGYDAGYNAGYSVGYRTGYQEGCGNCSRAAGVIVGGSCGETASSSGCECVPAAAVVGIGSC